MYSLSKPKIFNCYIVQGKSIRTTRTRTKIPQHPDFQVMEQLIYKWEHFKEVFSELLYAHYQSLNSKEVPVNRGGIENDVYAMFQANFWDFINENRE